MVRFTLRNMARSSSMRVDLDPRDDVSEISDIVLECWGSEGFLMTNGYRIIGEGNRTGMEISEGDVVDIIPDPRGIPTGFINRL